jgi:hypothetical protein
MKHQYICDLEMLHKALLLKNLHIAYVFAAKVNRPTPCECILDLEGDGLVLYA